uniref:Succinate dehydrogenase cytochrome b560 subunit, mitochondrial n=1 Tax=Caligus clemensi TaxID=344056 RepID=C1C048_CALCM|nr:Succinate dehydrogenase cytochrome b560 subunit, mitochondrial precursor [Caligus clemensi]
MASFLASRICRGVFLSGRMTRNGTPALGLRSVSMKPVSPEAVAPKESFWDKNKRLNRPMSPHLTIYKPQLTSMLSISHRISGMYLTAILYSGGFLPFVLPNNFPTFIQSIEIAPLLVTAGKFAIAFPFAFHTYNGLRHLLWDMGYGFKISEVYSSGAMVLAFSLITAIILTFL